MSFKWDFTPRHWEFGIGYYKAAWYVNFYTSEMESHPSEIAILLGPWTLSIFIGHNVTVVTGGNLRTTATTEEK